MGSNMALNLVPFCRWTLRDKAAQHRLALLRVPPMSASPTMRSHPAIAPRLAIIVILILLALLLAGCGPQYLWVKPGASQSDWSLDASECRVFAAGAVPRDPQRIPLTSGYRTSSLTTCSAFGRSVDCMTTGGDYVPPTYWAYDANESIRDEAVQICMHRKGWARVTKAELEAKTAQQPFPSTDDGSAKYVVEAGGYCNETNDCVRGLACNSHKCVQPANAPRSAVNPKKNSVGAGGYCRGDESCRSGLACADNKCVIDFGKPR